MSLQFRIFALSPDNDALLRKLTKLFWASYGRSYPIPGVYDLQFWKSHIGSRFVSIVGELDGELVCHIAYNEEVGVKGSAHLEHLVCHPDHFSQLPQIAKTLSEYLSNVAKRRSWHTLLASVKSGLPGTDTFLKEALQCKELGILPGYYPNHQLRNRPLSRNGTSGVPQSKRHSAQLFVKLFQQDFQERKTLYIPQKHASLVLNLNDQLGLARCIDHDLRSSCESTYSLPADTPAIRTCHYYQTGVSHSFLQPSLLGTAEDYLGQIAHCSKTDSPILFVNCEDPSAHHCVNELERYGYTFGGYLPQFFGNDQLVYFKRTSLTQAIEKAVYHQNGNPSSILAEHILNERRFVADKTD